MSVLVFLEKLHRELRPVLFAPGAVEQILGFDVTRIRPNCTPLLVRRQVGRQVGRQVARRLLAEGWDSRNAQQEPQNKSCKNCWRKKHDSKIFDAGFIPGASQSCGPEQHLINRYPRLNQPWL